MSVIFTTTEKSAKVQEQFAGFVQQLQKQPCPHRLMKLPEHEPMIPVRTPAGPSSCIPAHEWEAYLARKLGKARSEIEAAIAERAQDVGVPTIQAKQKSTVDEDGVWQ